MSKSENRDPPLELIYSLPKDVLKRFFGLWGIPQRKDYHPEGNTLKHALTVVKRAMHFYPDDMNIIIAALFHDIGKGTQADHSIRGAELIEPIATRIGFSKTEVDTLKFLVLHLLEILVHVS